MAFAPATRYPADPRAVFVLALCVVSGIGQFLVSGVPDSVEAALPRWAILVWGTCLLVGALITLTGMARQTRDGIIAEQVGSAVVGVATLFYVAIAVRELGWDAVTMPVGIVLGWGLSCFWRWGQLQSLIHEQVKKQQSRALEQMVMERIAREREGR